MNTQKIIVSEATQSTLSNVDGYKLNALIDNILAQGSTDRKSVV